MQDPSEYKKNRPKEEPASNDTPFGEPVASRNPFEGLSFAGVSFDDEEDEAEEAEAPLSAEEQFANAFGGDLFAEEEAVPVAEEETPDEEPEAAPEPTPVVASVVPPIAPKQKAIVADAPKKRVSVEEDVEPDGEDLDDEEWAAEDARRAKRIRNWFIALLAALLCLIVACLAFVMPLYQSYRDSFVDIDIVTRDEEYTRPAFPTDDIIIPGSDETMDWGDDTIDLPDDSDTEGTDTDSPVTTEPPVTTEKPDDRPVIENGIYYVKQKDPNVVNILILGVDTRDISKFSGRTDVMMVCSFNKRTGEVSLVSLLRDLLVPIEGHDWNRLNTAFAYGGISLCINTINQLFDLDIQKFVMINFAGTKTIIDACGGVDVKLTEGEVAYIEKNGGTVKAVGNGLYHLNGYSALTHMRNRSIGNDFGRTSRQRQVLTAVYQQVLSSRNLSEIYTLIQESFKLIRTNMKLKEILDLATGVVGFGTNLKINSAQIPKTGTYQGVYYKKKSVISFDIDANTAYLHKLLYE